MGAWAHILTLFFLATPAFADPSDSQKALLIRDAKAAMKNEDYPKLLLLLDKMLPLYPANAQDQILEKVRRTVLKISDQSVLKELKGEVKDPRVREKLIVRQIASVNGKSSLTTSFSRQTRILIDPYFAVSDTSFQDNATGGGAAASDSPTIYGVDIAGFVPLSAKVDLRLGVGLQHYEMIAPEGQALPVNQLNLVGGELDLGWYPFSSHRFRLGLKLDLEELPFVREVSTDNLAIFDVPATSVGLRLSYEEPLSKALTIGVMGYGSYFLSTLSSEVSSFSGYAHGVDISAYATLSDEVWIKIGGHYSYQLTRNTILNQARFWAGGGLGLLYTFSSP